MKALGCLALFAILVPVLLIVFLFASTKSLLRWLGFDVSSVNRNAGRSGAAGSQYSEQSQGRQQSSYREQSARRAGGREKIFEPDTNEYVDFEDVK